MLRLRPVTPEDTPFFREIYRSLRAVEFAAAGWPEETLAAFLNGQSDLRDAAYRSNYPEAEFSVVLSDDEPIGRLFLHRGPDGLHLIDIALLPPWRGLGLGTRLLRVLLEEARAGGRPIVAHVESGNRALALYERLGFVVTGSQGIYLRIEWRPI
jgi:ribosomal protein S18 acetylase RimI-like enzyme